MSEIELPPEIIVIGGQDLDGSWGTGKTFQRECVFELINVPLPMFMISPFIPAYNSFHPDYPFALAKESKISKNIETSYGRTVTITTTYQVLKPNKTLTGLSGWNIDAVIFDNLPHLLPAQDVTYESVAVEETLDHLYVDEEEEWVEMPFQTTAGTKLTGTTTRNILKMKFWYFVETLLLDESELVTQYTGVVNDDEIMIAGRNCPTGVAKIESIGVMDSTWERPESTPYTVKLIEVALLIDYKTWNKRYENVSSLFMAYPYAWETSDSGGKENTKMRLDEKTKQPLYYTHKRTNIITGETEWLLSNAESVPSDFIPINVSPQRIFCTMYDPEQKNEGYSDDPIWVSDPQKAIQFFGTREDCFRLNPDSEPTEVTEPMYLDKNGFVLYPDPATGKVDVALSPKIEGYVFKPIDFTPLHFPVT